jgi:hypothetical protein
MSENPMIDLMDKYSFDPDSDTWETYKRDFAKRNPMERVEQLKIIDAWLEQDPRPTRETAAKLVASREVWDLHRFLLAGQR